MDFATLTQIFNVFISVHPSHSLPWCLEGTLLLHVCTRGIQVSMPPVYVQPFFNHLSHCSVVPFSASAAFCHSTQRRGCVFSWISGVRSSKKLLGQEPKKKSCSFQSCISFCAFLESSEDSPQGRSYQSSLSLAAVNLNRPTKDFTRQPSLQAISPAH